MTAPVSLAPGTRLGHYEIVAFLGAGGMGEVYQARDLKLRRDVALKRLPAETAADPERRARFEREARAVAALNHPGIVTIYSVDEIDGHVFLTMELVEGRPLSDVIPQSGLPPDRLLALGVPLADAVSAAHARGITHRDLKPANVMVTPAGQVKVLDFGLAKLLEAQPTAEPTVTGAADLITGQGRILGTIAYMSPEQAEGKAVDARSDVFSLGVILYELATGERPFKGETSVSTLAAIIRDTPRSASDLNPAVPRELSRVIKRALAKDPDRRQQSGKDLRNELDDLRRDLESGDLAPVTASVTATSLGVTRPPTSSAGVAALPPASSTSSGTPAQGARSRGWLIAAATAVAVLGLGAFGVRWWGSASGSAPGPGGTDAPIEVDSVISVTAEDGVEQFPSLSPDGKWLVYSGNEPGADQPDILLRAVGGQTAINLTKDSPATDLQPAFSPDGERIAFRSSRDGGGIFVMGRTGESVRRLSDGGYFPAWSPDGRSLAYTTSLVNQPYGRGTASRLWIVDVTSGAQRQIDVPDAVQPAWSPHGHRIVYWAVSGDNVQRDLWTVRVDGSDPTRLTDDVAVDWSPVWSPDGRFVYFSSDRRGEFNLWRLPVDEAAGRPLGAPQPVTLPREGIGHLAFAADGVTLAATSNTSQANIEILEFDPVKRVVTGRRRVTNVSEITQSPSVSPDGQWIAFYRMTNGQEDIWMVNRDGSGLRRLTADAARDRQPVWTPDGRLVFYSDRGGRFQIWSMRIDGSDLRQLTDVPEQVIQPRLTGDGTRGFVNLPLARQNAMFDPRIAGAKSLEVWPPPPDGLVLTANDWSPDGRTVIAFGNRNRGVLLAYDVANRTYDELRPDGVWPVFTRDGRSLLYSLGGSTLHLLDLRTRRSTPLFDLERAVIGASPTVSPDGREIVISVLNRQSDIVLARLAAPPAASR